MAQVNDALPHDINVLDGRARAATLSRTPQRGGAQLPLPDRPAPHGVRQTLRLVGARATRRRSDARRPRARSSASQTSARSPTTTRKRSRRRCCSTTCVVEPHGSLILVRVVGSHFLWKMVRRIVGVLVEVGRGGIEPGAVPRAPRQRLAPAGATDRAGVRPVSRARVLRATARGLAARARNLELRSESVL